MSSEPIVIDKEAYASFSCPQLEQELVRLGGISARASGYQDMSSSKQVAATIIGGSVVNYANMKNAQKNEGKAKAQLENIYSLWDEKKCSEWLYERNSKAPNAR